MESGWIEEAGGRKKVMEKNTKELMWIEGYQDGRRNRTYIREI
ncbi:MAG: hypothetical protein WAV32_08880 [Halobacteriota archaeon]